MSPANDSLMATVSYLTISLSPSIWLTDLHKALPLARLDGYDSSEDQFPPKAWLPSNVSLRRLDALKLIPEELYAKYDIVHLRLFVYVIRDANPMPLLNNLKRMLSAF